MSHICRNCGSLMPKDRKGWEQVCPGCKSKSVDEILNKLVQDPELKKYPHSYNPIIIERAKLSLLELLTGEGSPAEKSMTDKNLKCYCDGEGYCNCNFSENEGYNNCRQDFIAWLKECLK